jgi:hypothetical protein
MSNRRSFLGVVLMGAAAAAATTMNRQVANAQAVPLTESDPIAQALGYKEDATKVDKAKFPKYVAGETCAGCQLFQGKPTDATAPCAAFGGKLVSGKGWCSAWVKRA